MMHSSDFESGIALLWILHTLGALAVFVGFLLLVMLLTKKLHEKQLRQWGLSLLIGGIVVCIFTLIALPVHKVKMDGMMRHDGVKGMSMGQMTMGLEGKSGDDFDKAFLEEMIVHHQGAVDMANAALNDAKHPELKAMAKAIITAQQKEIATMQQWEKSWGYSQ
jgi:hypothetical protein